MAYSVTFTPGPGLRLLRSPLMSVVRETDGTIRNNPTFRYFCRVQVWGGAPLPLPGAGDFIVATLLQSPRPDGAGVFNISPLLESVIAQVGAGDTVTNANTRLRNVRLRFGYFLNGTENLEVTSDYFQVSDGFAIQQQPVNRYEHDTDVIDAKRFLVPNQRIQIVRDQKAWVHVYVNQEDERRVQYRNIDGTFPQTVNLPANTRVWRLPIGIAEVNALVGTANFKPENGFLIQVIDSVSTATYQQLRVEVLDRPFCDMPADSIAYINRYGVWDYLHVRGQRFRSIGQERTEWLRRIGRVNQADAFAYTTGESEVGVTEVMGGETLSYQTGYVRADVINEKMVDLLMSKNFFSLALNRPIILKSQNIQLRNDNESELINYTLEFAIAGNLIQSIQ